jgi:hypothetical protein
MVDEPGMGRVYAANLASGKGGAGASFTDADFVRAIRHGVAPDGRELAIMPSQIFNHLSDQDLGALIAYLKTVPPVDNETPKPQLMPLGRIMLTAGMLGNDVFPAELIDLPAPRRIRAEPSSTVHRPSSISISTFSFSPLDWQIFVSFAVIIRAC